MNFERPANAAAQKSKRAAMGQVYYDKYSKLLYNYQKENVLQSGISAALTIAYYVVFQYMNKGQTIGKKLFKIRVKQDDEEKLNAGLFVLREAVLFVIPIQIIDIICYS